MPFFNFLAKRLVVSVEAGPILHVLHVLVTFAAPSSNAGSTRRLSITSTIEDDIPPSRFSRRSSRIPSRGLDQFRQDIKVLN